MARPWGRLGTMCRLVVLAALIAQTYAPAPAVAQVSATIEQLEAALLITFVRFVDWPGEMVPSADAPFVVGVVSDQTLTDAVNRAAAGRQIAGRPLVARRLQWDEDLAGVHVLFIGDPEQRRLPALLERVRHTKVLTVARLAEFGAAGGMITLQARGGRVGFSVNSRATELSGMRISSFLLSHATNVGGATKNGPR